MKGPCKGESSLFQNETESESSGRESFVSVTKISLDSEGHDYYLFSSQSQNMLVF